jgi:hypothetical protein
MAFPVGNTIVSAIPVGNKWLVTFDHTGPASYSQTTEDVVNAADLGFGGFENVDVTSDTTSQFQPYLKLTGAGYGGAVASVKMAWFALVTATLGGQAQTLGTEAVAATNLSTFSVRIQAWCV